MNEKRAWMIGFLRNLGFIAPILVPFLQNFGKLNMQQIMTLQSVYTFSNFILNIPTGMFADRFGRRMSLVVAGILNGLAGFIYVSYPSFYVFMIAEILWAAGKSFSFGALEAVTYESSHDKKKGFINLSTAALAGAMVGSPIGSIIAGYVDIRLPFILFGLSCLASSLVALGIKDSSRVSKRPGIKELIKSTSRILHDKNLSRVVSLFILGGFVFYYSFWFYQPALQRAGIPLAWFGLFHAALTISEIAMIRMMKPIEKIMSDRIAISSLFAISSFILFAAYIHPLAGVLIPLILIPAAYSIKTLLTLEINKLSSEKNRATITSASKSVADLLFSFINPLMGYVAINLPVAFLVMAMISVSGIFASLLYLKD